MRLQRVPLLLVFLAFLVPDISFAQRDLLPASDPLYRFLLRQQLTGNLHGFYWGMLPLSRGEVAAFLDSLEGNTTLSETDKKLLHDYEVQLSFDRTRLLDRTSSFIPGFDFEGIVDDARQKSLYISADSTTSLFFDVFGSLSYRTAKGDSVGKGSATLGEIGFRLRGTLYNRLGFYLQASNGKLLGGSHDIAIQDPILRANKKFNTDEKVYFDFTSGYLRYDAGWLALTAGREQLLWGMGFGDRMMFSDNTVPFDYIKIDIRSGSLRYSFLAGGLTSNDTLGHSVSSKYISSHRLEFSIGSPFRLGLSEAIIYSNQPPLFALLNPMTFLTSAEFSTEAVTAAGTDNAHNSLIWIDMQYDLLRNVRLSGTWLIDDISFAALGKSDLSGNTNKFGWQGGVLWNDAGGVNNLLLSLEYTRIGPFVETHRTIVNSFTHWELPLGDALQPNSDQWTVEARYDVTSRLSARARVRIQRTGENILDANGNIIFNAGSEFLRGDGDIVHPNIFLEGNRINRMLASLQLRWQPIRQYIIDLQLFHNRYHHLAPDRALTDTMIWCTLQVDY
jgi:hypothetical protein